MISEHGIPNRKELAETLNRMRLFTVLVSVFG